MKISSHGITDEEKIEEVNELLRDKGIRVEEGDTLGDYTTYRIYLMDEEVFRTIYPKELIIKLAQLVPESEVRLGRHEVYVGETDMSQETLVWKVAEKGDD